MKKCLNINLNGLFAVIALMVFFTVPQISISADVENISVPSGIQQDYGLDTSSYMFLNSSQGEVASGDRSAGQLVANGGVICPPRPPVPIPAAAWLLGSGLVGLLGIRRKMRS